MVVGEGRAARARHAPARRRRPDALRRRAALTERRSAGPPRSTPGPGSRRARSGPFLAYAATATRCLPWEPRRTGVRRRDVRARPAAVEEKPHPGDPAGARHARRDGEDVHPARGRARDRDPRRVRLAGSGAARWWRTMPREDRRGRRGERHGRLRRPSTATYEAQRLTVCVDVDDFPTPRPPANWRFQAAPAATWRQSGAPRSIVQASFQGSTAPGSKRSALRRRSSRAGSSRVRTSSSGCR